MIETVLFVLSISTLIYQVSSVSLGVFIATIVCVSLFITILLPNRKGLLYAVLFCFIAGIGCLNILRVQKDIPRTFYAERTLHGYVVSINKKLEETVVVFHDEEYEKNIQFKISHTNLLPRDTVSVIGVVRKPEDFVTDTGRIFPYKIYLQSKKIYGVMDEVSIVSQESGAFHPVRVATILRHNIAHLFAKYISFPVDGVVSGMLVGYQGGLSDEISNLFRDTGVLHVLVLSGSNITLFAGILAVVCKQLPSTIRVVLISGCIVLLVLISGSGVAATRAGIMGIAALLIPLCNKKYNARNILFLVYGFFLITAPYTVLYDPGFHLSFIATFSMIVIIPRIEKSITYIPKTKYIDIKELLLLAIGLPIIMLPYTMYFSGVVPVSTIISNILLALVLPLILFFGILVLLLSPLEPLANIFGMMLSSLGAYMIDCLYFFNQLPKLNTPPLSWWGVIIVYAVAGSIFFRKKLKQRVRQLRNLLQPLSSLVD